MEKIKSFLTKLFQKEERTTLKMRQLTDEELELVSGGIRYF